MSSFNEQTLFSSGPHRFHVGGLSLRHVLYETPGARGVRLGAQGLRGRAISQTGYLIADNPQQMRDLTDAVEARLDGVPHELIGDNDESFEDTVMLSFEPGPIAPAGARWRKFYRIGYLQLTP